MVRESAWWARLCARSMRPLSRMNSVMPLPRGTRTTLQRRVRNQSAVGGDPRPDRQIRALSKNRRHGPVSGSICGRCHEEPREGGVQAEESADPVCAAGPLGPCHACRLPIATRVRCHGRAPGVAGRVSCVAVRFRESDVRCASQGIYDSRSGPALHLQAQRHSPVPQWAPEESFKILLKMCPPSDSMRYGARLT